MIEIAQNAEMIIEFVLLVLLILDSKMENAYLAHQIVEVAKVIYRNVTLILVMIIMVQFMIKMLIQENVENALIIAENVFQIIQNARIMDAK